MRAVPGPSTLLLALGICSVAAAQADVDAAGKAFREGVAAVQANHLREAEQHFRTTVRLAPRVAAGHSALGAVLVQEAEYAHAVPELELALRLAPADSAAQLNLGTAAAGLLGTPASTSTQVDEAITALQEWQRLHSEPLPADTALALARLFSAKQQQDAALQTLQAALAASPDDPSLLDAYGAVLAQAGRFQEAVSPLRRALATAKGDAQAVAIEVRLGAALFQAGDETGALNTLQNAVKRAPQNMDAQYQLALTLESVGRNDEAIPLFAKVLAARPQNSEVLTNYGLALVQTGKAKEAVPLYLRAVKLTPDDATVHQDLGVAYLQQSDLDNAIAEFTRGTQLDPQSAQLAYDLGLAYKLKDRFPESIAAFERARALDPQLADAPYSLGVLYMQQGDFDKAAGVLRSAVALRPENADAWGMLGSVLKQDGKSQEAADALRRSIALDPGQPGNHVNLASVLIELGDKEGAARERRTAAELSRAATTRQKERFALDSGKLLLQRGQFAGAIAQFRNAVAADPNDAAAHQALADALAQSGAKAEAEVERSKAKSLEAQH